MNASWFVRIVTSGHRKSFHVHRNWITASVASAGSDSGTHDPQQDRQPRRAVDPRRLLELDRQRPEELGEHEDPEHVDQVRHDERAEAVEQPEVLHDQERGDQHDLQRHHQRGEQHEVDERRGRGTGSARTRTPRACTGPGCSPRPRRSRPWCSRTTVPNADCREHVQRSCRTGACPATGSAGSGSVCASVSSDVTTIHSSGSSITAASGARNRCHGSNGRKRRRGRSTIPVSPGERPRVESGCGAAGTSVTALMTSSG